MTLPTITHGAPSRLSGYWARACALPRSRPFLALADQAVTSIGNFATMVLVMRALPPENYGIYQMLIEGYQFLNSVQAGLVIYPLLIKGAAMEMPALRRLSGACLLLTLALGAILALGMIGTVGFTHSATSLWLLAPLAMILGQTQEMLRRTLIAHLRFAAAIPGDAISYCLQAVILWMLARHHALTVPSAFTAMAATSALAALVQAIQIGVQFDIGWADLVRLGRECISKGKWIVLANLATVVGFNGYSWTLYLSHGAGEVARCCVIGNMLRFANPVTQAMAGAIVPAVARASATGSLRAAQRAAMKYAGVAALFLIPFFGALLLFPGTMLALICKGQPEYVQLAPLLRIYAGSFTLMTVTTFVIAYLNGLGYSRVNFIGQMTNAAVNLLVGLPLIVWLGLRGSIYGSAFATSALTATVLYLAVRYRHPTPLIASGERSTCDAITSPQLDAAA